MERNRISVIIDGVTYNVISDEEEMHILKVTEMVDRQIRILKKKSNKYTPSMISVLAAMNIANDLIKFKLNDDSEKDRKLNQMMENKVKSLQDEIEAYKTTFNDLENKIFLIQRELMAKEEELKIKKAEQYSFFEADNLKKEQIEKMQKLLAQSDENLNENEKLLQTLKDKIAILQIELDEKEEELKQIKKIHHISLEKANEDLLEEFDKKINELSEKAKIKEELLNASDEKIFSLQKKLNEKEEEFQHILQEQQSFFDLDLQQEDIDNMKKTVMELEEENGKNKELVKISNQKISELYQMIAEKDQAFHTYEMNYQIALRKMQEDMSKEMEKNRFLFDKTIAEKEELLNQSDEKIFFLQRKLIEKEEEIQNNMLNSKHEEKTESDEFLLERLNELEEKIKIKDSMLNQSDEKIFYLQRKLTDKEEELQRSVRELEEFIEEFDK
ncbi:MAG: hypothetical protein JW702_03220 [Clostridiales bacterium]|nr:hypothetical protein [Clostridiales bacterium]